MKPGPISYKVKDTAQIAISDLHVQCEWLVEWNGVDFSLHCLCKRREMDSMQAADLKTK